METVRELLEHLQRQPDPALTIQDVDGRPLAVVVRLDPARRLPPPVTILEDLQRRGGTIGLRTGRTPKGTKRSRRQRQAAKHKRKMRPTDQEGQREEGPGEA